MIAAIGVVPVALYLLGWDEDVFAVFPAPRIKLAVFVPDLGRVAVRAVAAAERRVIRHVPGRIELFVQSLILRRMLAMGSTLPNLLCPDRRSEAKEENAR
ncbi:hypothetical protein QA640_24835 [Bradyrhizobium sp. CB82]|uniref:hypothetical protein n=1 Tax=Bradyrhizobium sp. CB82 TaxID=3039159 RepID=UPI0024B22F61|nr:hypothetical protein [Bradyrhizobium sp. CB82]WFU37693.1 hypothetical protein QA640_24835 [Bradyrhizobium sp. CB82]